MNNQTPLNVVLLLCSLFFIACSNEKPISKEANSVQIFNPEVKSFDEYINHAEKNPVLPAPKTADYTYEPNHEAEENFLCKKNASDKIQLERLKKLMPEQMKECIVNEYQINLKEANLIEGNNGVDLFLPVGAFVHPESLLPIMDEVKLKVEEYANVNQMFFGGFTTVTKDGVLQTGGSVSIRAFYGDTELLPNTQAKMGIKFNNPDNYEVDEMTYWSGAEQENGETEWASIAAAPLQIDPQKPFKVIRNNSKSEVRVSEGINFFERNLVVSPRYSFKSDQTFTEVFTRKVYKLLPKSKKARKAMKKSIHFTTQKNNISVSFTLTANKEIKNVSYSYDKHPIILEALQQTVSEINAKRPASIDKVPVDYDYQFTLNSFRKGKATIHITKSELNAASARNLLNQSRSSFTKQTTVRHLQQSVNEQAFSELNMTRFVNFDKLPASQSRPIFVKNTFPEGTTVKVISAQEQYLFSMGMRYDTKDFYFPKFPKKTQAYVVAVYIDDNDNVFLGFNSIAKIKDNPDYIRISNFKKVETEKLYDLIAKFSDKRLPEIIV